VRGRIVKKIVVLGSVNDDAAIADRKLPATGEILTAARENRT